MANIPGNNDNINYFSAVDPKGNSLGFSDLKDTSGKPLFAYRNPGDTATTTDMTRVATTFDPRVPQPLVQSMLTNGRMPQSVSDPIRASLGGNYNDELDHTIALELAGSNNPANLRLEHGAKIPGGESANFDFEENTLAHQVVTGQISLFDAQVKLAADKRTAGDQNPVPWTPTSPAVPSASNKPQATTQDTSGLLPGQAISSQSNPAPSATAPTLAATMQSVIPGVQQSVSGNVISMIGNRPVFDPNIRGDSFDQMYAARHKTGVFNPNAPMAAQTPNNINLFKQDHIIPLWAGGSDTADNVAKFDLPTYQQRQAIFAVPFTLLANKQITQGQAKVMAINALNNQQDTSGVPTPGPTGLIPLDVAKKVSQQWADHDANPNPTTLSSVLGEFPQALSNFGKGWLPDPIREFGKGLFGGVTAGLIPGSEASQGEDSLSKLANYGGNIAGMFTGIGALEEGLGALGKGLGLIKNVSKVTETAGEAAKSVGLTADAIDYGLKTPSLAAQTMGSIAKTAGLLTLWNNVIGIGGKELTGQQQFDFGNHVKQFWTDLAYGGLLGSAGQSIMGYAGVGLGSSVISLMSGSNIQDALKNGALMAALHTMGLKQNEFKAGDPMFTYKGQMNQIASDQAFKMAAVTFDQYGQPISPVKIGEQVPGVFFVDPDKIDQLKAEYKQEHPNDTRFDNLENTNSAGAIQLMSRNARAKLMDYVERSNGSISQEQVKQELTRIITSENQLINQTMDPENRLQKQAADLKTMVQKLKPQVPSDNIKFVTNASEVFNKIDFNKIGDNPNGEGFALQGPTTIVGYGQGLDEQAQKTVDDIAKNPDKYKSFVVGVNDEETNNFQKLINQEKAAKGQRVSGDPNDTVRFYALEIGKDGELIPHPVGYMPKPESYTKIGEKGEDTSVNKSYNEITKRLLNLINTAKNPEELQTWLQADKSVNNNPELQSNKVDLETAKRLFGKKGKLSEEEMYNILKPTNAHTKYNPELNTTKVSAEMRKSSQSYVVADISKQWMINGREYFRAPRENVYNPFIEINFTNNNPQESKIPFESVNPILDRISNTKAKASAQRVSSIAGDILKKTANPFIEEQAPVKVPTPKVEPPYGELTLAEVKEMRKQGFSENIIQMAGKKKPIQNQLVTTFSPDKSFSSETGGFIDTTKPDIATKIAQTATKEYPTTGDIQKVAESKGIIWNNDPGFMELTKTITGKSHLDNLTSAERKTMYDYLSKATVKQPEAPQNQLVETTRSVTKETPPVDSSPKGKDRQVYRNLENQVNTIVQEATDEGRSVTKKEYSEISALTKKMGEIVKKYKNIPEIPKGEAKNLYESPLSGETYEEPKAGTAAELAETTEQKDALEQAEQLATKMKSSDITPEEKDEYKQKIQDLAGNFEVKAPITEQKILDLLSSEPEAEYKTPDQRLAEKYGLSLKLDKTGKWLNLETKNGQPIFSQDYLKQNPELRGKSPTQIYGKTLADDMRAFGFSKTISSREWMRNLNRMAQSPDLETKVTGQILKETFKTLAGEKSPATSWTMNSFLKQKGPMIQRLLKETSQTGYSLSQPTERIVAKVEGASPVEIGAIDRQTKEQETENESQRLALMGTETGKKEGNIAGKLQGGVHHETDLAKQQDILNFENQAPALSGLYESITGKKPPIEAIAKDASNLAYEFVKGWNQKLKASGKKGVFVDLKNIQKNVLDSLKPKQ